MLLSMFTYIDTKVSITIINFWTYIKVYLSIIIKGIRIQNMIIMTTPVFSNFIEY